MTMIDVILSAAAILIFACGFIGGYVLCYRKWQMDKAQWLADARRLASFNDRVYREAVGDRYGPTIAPGWQHRASGNIWNGAGPPSAQRERGGIL